MKRTPKRKFLTTEEILGIKKSQLTPNLEAIPETVNTVLKPLLDGFNIGKLSKYAAKIENQYSIPNLSENLITYCNNIIYPTIIEYPKVDKFRYNKKDEFIYLFFITIYLANEKKHFADLFSKTIETGLKAFEEQKSFFDKMFISNLFNLLIEILPNETHKTILLHSIKKIFNRKVKPANLTALIRNPRLVDNNSPYRIFFISGRFISSYEGPGNEDVEFMRSCVLVFENIWKIYQKYLEQQNRSLIIESIIHDAVHGVCQKINKYNMLDNMLDLCTDLKRFYQASQLQILLTFCIRINCRDGELETLIDTCKGDENDKAFLSYLYKYYRRESPDKNTLNSIDVMRLHYKLVPIYQSIKNENIIRDINKCKDEQAIEAVKNMMMVNSYRGILVRHFIKDFLQSKRYIVLSATIKHLQNTYKNINLNFDLTNIILNLKQKGLDLTEEDLEAIETLDITYANQISNVLLSNLDIKETNDDNSKENDIISSDNNQLKTEIVDIKTNPKLEIKNDIAIQETSHDDPPKTVHIGQYNILNKKHKQKKYLEEISKALEKNPSFLEGCSFNLCIINYLMGKGEKFQAFYNLLIPEEKNFLLSLFNITGYADLTQQEPLLSVNEKQLKVFFKILDNSILNNIVSEKDPNKTGWIVNDKFFTISQVRHVRDLPKFNLKVYCIFDEDLKVETNNMALLGFIERYGKCGIKSQDPRVLGIGHLNENGLLFYCSTLIPKHPDVKPFVKANPTTEWKVVPSSPEKNQSLSSITS